MSESGEHAVAVADGFVAGEAQAAEDVFGGTNEAGFDGGVQGCSWWSGFSLRQGGVRAEGFRPATLRSR